MTTQKLKPVYFLFFAIVFTCMCGKTDSMMQGKSPPSSLAPEFAISGSIVFHSNMDGDNEIYLINKNSVTKLTDNTWNDEYPVWSPDGKRIAYTADPEGHYDIFVMKADGSQITRLTNAESQEKEPAWFPDGNSLAYSREIKKFLRKQLTIWLVDIRTKKTEKIIPGYDRDHAIPWLSPKGGLMTFTGKRTIGWDVAMYDMEKKEVKFLDEGGKSCRARFSKNGRKLAYVSSKADGKGDIWIMDPDGAEKKRLTDTAETYDYFPDWSPDGNFIVFNSSHQHDHNGDWALFIIDVKTREVRLLFDSPGNDVFPDWR